MYIQVILTNIGDSERNVSYIKTPPKDEMESKMKRLL